MRSRTQGWRRIALTCAASLVTASAAASAAPEGEGGGGAAAANQRLAPDLAEPVLLKAGDKPVDAEGIGHAAPFFGDFDGDKRPDLLVGQFKDGTLAVYRNEGTATAPVFKNRTWFKAGADLGKVPTG